MAKFLDKTGLDTFWAKIKSTFQTLGNLVTTSTAWGSTPSDTKYPSEKLVKTSLDAKAPNAPSEVTIANGDKPLIADSSDGNKVKRASITFDTGVPTTYLCRNGVFNAVKEADVIWGGSFRAELSPAEFGNMARNLVHNPITTAITFEITTDGGTTWTLYERTDPVIRALCNLAGSGAGSQFGLTNALYSGVTDPTTIKGRLTIYAISSPSIEETENTWFYGIVKRILVKISRSGDARMKVEYQTWPHFIGDKVWGDVGTFTVMGDSGWNSIPFDQTIGGYSGQLSGGRIIALRFTYWIESGTAPRISVLNIGFLPQIHWTSNAGNIPLLGVPITIHDNGTGRIEYANRFYTARKLAVSLSNTSTDTSFDGSADVTNIKTTGTLAPGNGGTGKTSLKAAEYNLTTGKSEISDTTSGDDRVVFELASPSEGNGVTRGFRKLSTIWTWIKGLLSSESGVNISGNAATASAAQSGSALETAINGKMNTSASNATAPSGSGGDGATATLLNNLTDGNSDIVTTDDGDNVLIATTDNGGSVTNKWYKRKLVKLIPWIIKKLGTRLVYDCGAGSTSGDDFDAALAAFNAGQWVIIRNDGKTYYCVGSYSGPGLRFKQIANDGSLLKVNTISWTRGSSPSAITQIEASLSGHTHSQYLTASDITGKMATDCSNKASGALQNLTSQLTEGTSAFTDGTEIFSSYASDSGFATTDHVNQPYRRTASSMLKYIANSGLAQFVQIYGNSAKKLEIGYATIADTGNSSEMKALVELTCVMQSSTSQPGSSILMLVSVSCANANRFAKATILENTFWDGRTRPVIVTKVVSNRMYVYVGLLANNGTSLVGFDYTYAKITRIGFVNNWTWEHEYTSDGTFDHIFYCDDSVKFVPTVNSNTIGTTAGISNNSPADACVTYWSAMQPGCIRIVYNQNGTEYTILFSKSSDGKYGSILKWSYTDNYMRIIRIQNNSVLTGADWVKISAGYADSAGSLSSSVSVGSANQPVYFNNGVPTACNWWVS